jgi:hypothetical protein
MDHGFVPPINFFECITDLSEGCPFAGSIYAECKQVAFAGFGSPVRASSDCCTSSLLRSARSFARRLI